MFGLMNTDSPSCTTLPIPPTASSTSRVMSARRVPRTAATWAVGWTGPVGGCPQASPVTPPLATPPTASADTRTNSLRLMSPICPPR